MADFVIPLCGTIHLSGSTLKIVACAFAISFMTGMPTDLGLYTDDDSPVYRDGQLRNGLQCHR